MRREERYGGRGMGRLVDTYDVKVERQIWGVGWVERGRAGVWLERDTRTLLLFKNKFRKDKR